MKPIELELSWFGQYTLPQCIPFHALDKVFLITGETGAGKTTLFDAICYALYGRGLGARSSALALRSELAAETDSTVVRFRFEARGVTWEVKRSPHQYVRTKRTGTHEIDTYVTLHRLSGEGSPEVIPPTEVAERLHAVIGLKYADFSKILVLPQGEFQQFLTMKSADRATLLKTLFPVSQYEAIALRAKDEVKAVSKEVGENEAAVKEVKRNFDEEGFPTRELELQAQVEALRVAEVETRKAADGAMKALHDAGTLTKQIADLAEHIEARAKHLLGRDAHEARQTKLEAGRRAANAIPPVKKLEELTEELTQLDQKLRDASQADSDAKSKADLIRPAHDGLAMREQALTASKLAVQDLQGRLADLRALSTELEEESGLIANARDCATSVATAKTAVEVADHAVKALDDVAAARDSLRPSLDAANKAVTDCELSRTDAVAVKKWNEETSARIDAELDAEVAKLKLCDDERFDADVALAAARARVAADAALVVAHSLRPGEPCPACGSPDHPRPRTGAAEDGDALALLRAAEQDFARADDARGAQATRIAEMQAGATHAKNNAQEAAQRLQEAGYSGPAAWQLALNEVDARSKLLAAQDSALATQLQARPRLTEEATTARETLDNLNEALQTATGKLSAVSGEIVGLRKRVGVVLDVAAEVVAATVTQSSADAANVAEEIAIGKLRNEWLEAQSAVAATESSVKSLRAERDEKSSQLPSAQIAAAAALKEQGFATAEIARLAAVPPRDLEALQREVSDWVTTLAEFGPVIDGLEAAIGERPKPDIEALEESERKAANAATEAADQRRTHEEELNGLRRTAKRLGELREAKATLLADKNGLLVLARHLNGDVAPKIDFATWMLTWWLEQVLAHASTRMSTLSDARYTFRLRTDGKDGRAAAGLDVDVHDTWSNNLRDVNALSGGEKFLASLSLALGLADVVQSHNGGVHLDTLFIDEGFGSLDIDTLERAMGLIHHISQHRSVGLISHVESMQKSIYSQVVVTKSPKGSVATVR